jgi:hypothetical protein
LQSADQPQWTNTVYDKIIANEIQDKTKIITISKNKEKK